MPYKIPAKPLARVGDPYVTAWGQRVAPESMVKSEPPIPKVAHKSFRPATKRSIKELPAPPDIINGVACVFLYTVLGVGDREIAEALKIGVPDVKTVRASAAYNECFETIVGEFINVNSDLISARIAGYSHAALDAVADIAVNGTKEGNKLKAGIDLLDRGGHSKKENSARAISAGDGLRIVLIDGEKSVSVTVGPEARHD